MPARHCKRVFGILIIVIVAVNSAIGATTTTTTTAATDQSNWPQWRGPLCSGAAPSADPPTTWGEGRNVRWKVKLPGGGTSTPIIWGDSIFIQAAIATKPSSDAPAAAAAAPAVLRVADPAPAERPPGGRRGGRGGGGGGGGFGALPPPTEPYQFVLLCLDRKTGEPRWQKVAREEIPHEGHHRDHGFSSYSPVTDGKHVYAYFGSRGLHCFDMEGNLKWQKDLGRMQTRNGFGEGSSPALFGDTIVINWDHEGDDFIIALDKNSGDQRWREARDEKQSWSTPLIVEHDGQAQVVTAATGKIRSYDLKTGKQIWEAPGLTPNTIPSPVAGNGMVFATAGFGGSALYAIRLGRSADLSGTDAIAWTVKRGTPYVPSPLLYGERLYLYSGNNAILSCFDARSGKPIVETERIDDLEGVYASPIGAAGRVYLVGRNGATVVMKHLDQSDKIEVLATNQLDERFDASPAAVGKELFLRGQTYLYCIAER
jgi:outer membrane protein assembly factor BamB